MNHDKFIYAFAILMLTLLTLNVGKATAQTTANGPYYAWPSWDQTLPSNTRFIVLSNMGSNAVLDRETGLVWEKSPSASPSNFAQAHDACNRLSLGGRMGWRLPTAAELASLLDPTTSVPALPAGQPFETVQTTLTASFYWTTTPDLRVPGNAYVVDFRIPRLLSFTQLFNGGFRWCVRGGLGASTQ